MLPFLKSHDEDSASSSEPIKTIHRKADDGSEYDPLESACEDLCHALNKKDFKAMAEAWRAGFELMELEPHKEGPHE